MSSACNPLINDDVQPQVTSPAVRVVTKVLPTLELEGPAVLHAAEAFACSHFEKNLPVSRDTVYQLAELLLDDATVVDGTPGKRFVTGVSPRPGVRAPHDNAFNFPLSSLILQEYVTSVDPDFSFDSVALCLNLKTSMHKDCDNAGDWNLLCAISHFRGGEVWEEYAAGTCVRFCGCTPVNGRLHPLDAGHIYLRSKSALHQTEPWEGDRLILIAYQCRPTSHSTSSPPLAVQYPVPSQLEEFLAKARSRVSGKPLHQLMFVEVFAGTAGFCAAVRRQGLHRSVGVDHQAPRNVQAPLVVLDLTNIGQRTLLLQMLQNPDVVACHLAPPCGTSSLARNIPNGGPPSAP